ncbi:Acyl-CoA thioester hydrolase / Bile acid-CoA amino acid N-acetyltransferase, partial [Ostertagia ostertagi]
MSLYVDVHDSMQNERLHIRATNLAPNGIYKLVLRLKHKFGTHMSYAVFKADSAGEIDVPTATPLRGSYSEADPMGLFMSVEPCEDFPFGIYLRCTPPLPFVYNLILLDSGDRELAMVPIKKHWMHPNLERIEIEEDGFCGTLFKPPGNGPFPAVIDISGTGGGLHEHKPLNCLLQKPIKWLKRQSFTTDRLGIQGVSFGATIVLVLATRFPQLDAVVAINGPHVLTDYATLKENGKPIPQAQLANDRIRFINGVMASDKMFHYSTFDETSEIPWHRTSPHTSFRIVAAVDDLAAPSLFCGRYVTKKLRDIGRDVEIQLVNGGHFMEPPYFPHHGAVYAKFQEVISIFALKMSLYVDVHDSMQNERLHIRAAHLAPNGIYKLVLRLKHKFGTHMSYAVFKADSAGEIDVPTAKPLRGSYSEADPMGLFMSIEPCEDFPFGGYLRCTPPIPFIYNLINFMVKMPLYDLSVCWTPVIVNWRWYRSRKHWMHPNLERIEIEEDGFCGTLFKPPGDGPFPAVIDISGTGGGLHEHKGSMLASEGFVVLCVAFFQYKNLVETLSEVDLEYFERPIKWIKRQPFTTDRLGIQGVSFGATIVLLLATRFPQVSSNNPESRGHSED